MLHGIAQVSNGSFVAACRQASAASGDLTESAQGGRDLLTFKLAPPSGGIDFELGTTDYVDHGNSLSTAMKLPNHTS